MRGINKKGFTLIELLAVIVVLAIVMVLAATTVLPYMADARKESFVTEAETFKSAASQAVSLIQVGTVTGDYTKGDGDYCFSVANLKDDLALFKKDDSSYEGVVIVNKNASGKGYTYLVKMKNKDFYVSQTASGNIKKTDVKDVAGTAPTSTEVPVECK